MSGRRLQCLFVGHAASRSGAPLLLTWIIGWLKQQNQTQVHPATVLCSGGALVDEYQLLGPLFSHARWKLGETWLRRLGQVSFGKFLGRCSLRIWAWRYGIQPDLVYLNTLAIGSLVEDLRCLWPTVPMLTHVHEMPLAIDLLGRQRVLVQLQHSSYLIACSDDVVKGLKLVFPDLSRPTEVIPEPVRPRTNNLWKGASLRERLGIHSGTFVIGSIGSVDLRKGFDLVPQILSNLRLQLSSFDVAYVWIGCNQDEYLYKTVAHDLLTLGLSSRFFGLPQVPDPTELLADFDLLLLPSREDPYPLVALEAFLERVPVLCFQHAGGISSLARQGLVKAVPYLNVEALAEAVLTAAGEMSPFQAMADRAAAYAQATSNLDVVGQAVLDAIDACLAQKMSDG